MLVYANSGSTIHLGRVGENLATEVVFDLTKYTKEFGEGTVELLVQRGSTLYPQIINRSESTTYSYYVNEELNAGNYFFASAERTNCFIYFTLPNPVPVGCTLTYDPTKAETYFKIKIDNGINFYTVNCNTIKIFEEGIFGEVPKEIEINNVTYIPVSFSSQETKTENRYAFWKVTSFDTKEAGMGKCSLSFFVNDVVVKTVIYNTLVTNALGEDEDEAPDDYNWVEQILSAAAAIENNVDESYNYRLDAEKWAVGTYGGNPVADTDETYNNHSKYWAQESRDRAAAAKASELAAEADRADTEQYLIEAREIDGRITSINTDLTNKHSEVQAWHQDVNDKHTDVVEKADIVNTQSEQVALQYAKALEAAETTVEYSTHPPKIVDGEWWVWDGNLKPQPDYRRTGLKVTLSIVKTFTTPEEMNTGGTSLEEGAIVAVTYDGAQDAKLYIKDSKGNWDLAGTLGNIQINVESAITEHNYDPNAHKEQNWASVELKTWTSGNI